MQFFLELLWRAFQSTLDFLGTPLRVLVFTSCVLVVAAAVKLFQQVRKAGMKEGFRQLLQHWRENLTVVSIAVTVAYIVLFAVHLFYVVPNRVWREAANTQLPALLIATPPSVPTDLLRGLRVGRPRVQPTPADETLMLIPKIAEDIEALKRQTATKEPRRIPPEMWEPLLVRLSSLPSHARVEVNGGDDEAYGYAAQFFDILKQSGWILEQNKVQIFFSSAPPIQGVLLRVEDENYRPAILLLQALLDAGIAARGEKVRGLGKNLVVVQVGRR